MTKKTKAKKEWIREVRQKAEEALYLCDEAERGKISAEEFEKRLSKSLSDLTGLVTFGKERTPSTYGETMKKKTKKELIREVRQKAEQALNLCDKAENGKISAEEFEKRFSKYLLHPQGTPGRGVGFWHP